MSKTYHNRTQLIFWLSPMIFKYLCQTSRMHEANYINYKKKNVLLLRVFYSSSLSPTDNNKNCCRFFIYSYYSIIHNNNNNRFALLLFYQTKKIIKREDKQFAELKWRNYRFERFSYKNWNIKMKLPSNLKLFKLHGFILNVHIVQRFQSSSHVTKYLVKINFDYILWTEKWF